MGAEVLTVADKLFWLAKHFNVFTAHARIDIIIDLVNKTFMGKDLSDAIESAFSELFFEEGK